QMGPAAAGASAGAIARQAGDATNGLPKDPPLMAKTDSAPSAARPGTSAAASPSSPISATSPANTTAALVLEDGTVLWGKGAGASGTVVGEICFNTGLTGYQEVLTDPSYAGQIITFTFPHIGN